MKSNQRLDYDRLAEALRERKLLDAETLRHVLHQCNSTGSLFPELLVRENLVADWELARVSCEVFGLPYLPVDVYAPNQDLLAQLDTSLLRQFGLVPLDRYGDLLTVSMPAVVPSSVLAELEERSSCRALPVVGSIVANRNWLEEHLPKVDMPDMEELAGGLESVLGVLDIGDEAVHANDSPPASGGGPGLDLAGIDDVDDVDGSPAPPATSGSNDDGDENDFTFDLDRALGDGLPSDDSDDDSAAA